MSTLAVIVLTRNEEENIVDVVENARSCATEVLIIDCGSTDRTVELAKRHGAKIFYRAWDGDFSAQRNFALDKTTADFVLYLDADERLTPAAIDHVKKILAQGSVAQYKIQRKAISFGVTFNHGVLYPDYVLRLFPREKVRWVGKVHEHPECSCAIEKLHGYLEHYTYRDWAAWEEKFRLYTTLWAKGAYQSGKRTSKPAALLHAGFGFFRMFFLRLGFLDGWYGVYLSVNHFFYTLMKYLKLLELQENEKRPRK